MVQNRIWCEVLEFGGGMEKGNRSEGAVAKSQKWREGESLENLGLDRGGFLTERERILEQVI